LKIYAATRAGYAAPIIVTTVRKFDSTMLPAITAAGSGPVRYILSIGNGFAATATQEAAQGLAALDFVLTVFYDEPIHAIGGHP
jgi:hypothetical protein